MDTIAQDDTLADDAWKDSFDKLLEQKPVLREMNFLKKDVRASFNLNSSYENSSFEHSTRESPQQKWKKVAIRASPSARYLSVPKTNFKYKNKLETISTPSRKTDSIFPFRCTLSPIGNWKLQNTEGTTEKGQATIFDGTPITSGIEIDFANCPSLNQEECSKSDKAAPSILELVVHNIKSKKRPKNVCFDSNVVCQEPKRENDIHTREPLPVIALQPGKWRKSLNLIRRTQSTPMEKPKDSDLGKSKPKESLSKGLCGQRKSTLQRKVSSLGKRKENFKTQLLRRCKQQSIISFPEAYSVSYLTNCRKIGEGAFGEVFLHTKSTGRLIEKTVLKIIPIEGKQLVNGEVQKTYEQIHQEVVISMELSALKNTKRGSNFAAGFVNVERVRCVKGQYPQHLQKLWENFDDEKESENDHPECFGPSQEYIILEMTFSGEDMEKFMFRNAEQSFYALHQIIFTLAAAEYAFEFEHRDLHWGNVLVLNTNEKFLTYKLKGHIITLPTKGVKVTIIDYTLSRVTYGNCCFYNDLSNDTELFSATGDYQFDIYRMMREILNDKWDIYQAKTNIFWISYILSKMLDGVSYKNYQTKVHSEYMEKLRTLSSTILTYTSCSECANHLSTMLQ
uniref:non-specific serine/threonine protein kinase n=1 Tax=Stomoxys calcitrans TaxID=35570 RepID=A0A1I8Q9Y6_STOCA